nr:MAG TPA: hypothetical protein [Caudoviricetes sp.]
MVYCSTEKAVQPPLYPFETYNQVYSYKLHCHGTSTYKVYSPD